MNKSFHERATGILSIIAVILTFLLPIKFGMIAGTPEVAFSIPGNLMRLAFFTWPPSLFYLASALLLLGVTIFCPTPEIKNLKMPTSLIAFTWVLLLLTSLAGAVNASVYDFVFLQIIHFSGIACFAIAIMRLIQIRPEIKIWLLNAIVASTILTALMGLNQYISGFKATLDYVYKQEIETGIKVSSGMQNRLMQTRIFGPFSICNSLAAHLIITIPLCLWAILKNISTLKTVVAVSGAYALLMLVFAEIHPFLFFICIFIVLAVTLLIIIRGNKKNFKYIMPAGLIFSALLLFFILRYTNSRGGMIAFAFSMLFLLFLAPLNKKLRMLFGLLIAVVTVPFIFSDIFARSLSSMEVRFDYFLSALKIFKSHPFFGTGWGDFFHEYTTIKTFPGSEAPHTPHNFILSFASQTGILGFTAAVLVISAPFWFYFRDRQKYSFNWKNAIIITGWSAWGIHSLVDFNIQVCGTVATGIVMLMLLDLKTPDKEKDESNSYRKTKILWYIPLLILSFSTIFFAIDRLKYNSEFTILSDLCKPKQKTKASFEEIEIQLKRTQQIMPQSPFPYINAGAYALYLGEWARAEMYYLKAVKLSPERASLYYRLAIAQQKLGKEQEAIKNLKKAAALFPNAYNADYEKLNSKGLRF